MGVGELGGIIFLGVAGQGGNAPLDGPAAEVGHRYVGTQHSWAELNCWTCTLLDQRFVGFGTFEDWHIPWACECRSASGLSVK
eukprot:s634_g20.t1